MSLLVRGFVGFLRLFALDKRSLALFRVAIAVTTLYDIFNRGMLSRALVLEKFQNQYWISVHMLAGTDFYVQLIFLAHAAIALCMMVGYRTRLFTFLNWIMVCSLQNRNYLVCHSGDTVQRVMLFWAIFLPIGEIFSLDSILWPKNKNLDKNGGNRHTEVLGVAAMCFTVQIYIMYFTAHFHKSAPEWRELGAATWMALQLDFFRTWVGDIFMLFPWVCKQLTFAVLYWQCTGVAIYFLPTGKYNKYFKAFSVLGFMFMHASFGMCLNLEQFTWVTEASLSGVIPGWVWDALFKYFSRNQKRTMYIFYIARNKYRAMFAEILGLFMLPKTKMVPSDILPGGVTGGILGMSVIDANKVQHNGADALEAITKSSPLLYPLHYAFNTNVVKSGMNCVPNLCYEVVDPEFGNIKHKEYDYEMNDGAMQDPEQCTKVSVGSYDGASENGYSTKQVFVQENPSILYCYPLHHYQKYDFDVVTAMYALRKAIPVSFGVMKSLLLTVLLVLVITWNAGNIGYHAIATPYSLRPMLWVTQLDQYWGMFAPRPPDVMWWYNIEAVLDDGTKAELFNNGALFSFKPNVPHTYLKFTIATPRAHIASDVLTPRTNCGYLTIHNFFGSNALLGICLTFLGIGCLIANRYDKPRSLHESMGNHRWFKIFENGLNAHEEREVLKLNFGRWLCREYNERHQGSERLYTFAVHWMNERVDIVKQDGTRYPGQKYTIWNHMCYEK